MKSIKDYKNGVSLLEVMIAIVVLGIVAITAGTSIEMAAKARRRARFEQAALIEADRLMERTMAEVTSNTCSSGTACLLGSNFEAASNPALTWTFDGMDLGKQIALTNTSDLVHISVVVGWPDGNIQLEAYKCVRE